MADVKVPALLHKMSKAAQKAWYKKNNMKMPDDMEGRSAAAAKKVKVTPRKEIAVEPGSVRALNAARQQAYMAKGGRQPIGAAGSGGHSSMAGSNMSTAKGMIAGIKAGFNPKVSLDPYESEKAKKVGPRSLKMKKEEVELDEANMRFDYEAAARPKSSDVKNFLNRDKNPRAAAASKKYIRRMTKLGGLGPNQTKKDTEAHMKAHFEEVELDEGSKRMSAAVKLQRAFDREKTASDASRKRGEEVLAQARAEYAKKQVAKTNEEAEQVDESLLKGLKRAQVKWNTAHRAVYGKDPSAKSMMIGAIARLAGAKAHTARSVSTQIAGKPVTAQQQAAAKARAGKANMAKMRNEAKETADSNDVNAGVKGKKAAERMTKKAAEIRKTKIEGSVNKINMEPTIDLNKKAEK